MYFYVDESGNTGLELFDKEQPFLYYGVLSSKFNLDVLCKATVERLREKSGVERLHAAELGNGRLIDMVDDIDGLVKKYDIRFAFYRIAKADHALISFFDQVFDQGLNPAVPWTTYWTPLRYVILVKLASLFDDELLQDAWKARITIKNDVAEQTLVDVCKKLIQRVHVLDDARATEVIKDALTWVSQNPSEISYNIDSKKSSLQISPNLIGFQSVLHGIAALLSKTKAKTKMIVVDRQSQFNKAQEFITEIYQKSRHVDFMSGPGLPKMDLKNMPDVAISCTPGTASVGLELVDIFIWTFKRHFEGKELAPQLYKLIKGQLKRGQYDEVSINAIAKRWGNWMKSLPAPTTEQLAKAKALINEQEESRKKSL